MTITVNNDMLETIRDDPDEKWDDDPITFSIGVDSGGIIEELLGFLGIEPFDTTRVAFDPAAPLPPDIPKMIEIAELWDDVIADSINYVANNDDADIIVNKVNGLPGTAAGVTFSTLHVPIIEDDADVYLPNAQIMAGTITWRAAVHEFGHALGLQHPGDYDANEGPTVYGEDNDFAEDTGQFSVMSYFDPANFGSGWTTGTGGNAWSRTEILTPMIYDILAIQEYYGIDTTTRTDSTTYGFHSNADRSVYQFSPLQKPVLTIWDAGGEFDRLDVSGFQSSMGVAFTGSQLIDLHEGSYSDIAGYQRNIGIAFHTWIEQAIGGAGADTLIGNHLNNYLDGNAGVDTLRGELGDDTYVVDQAADNVVELLNEGNDTVNALSNTFTLSDNVERLVYVGDPNTAFTGNGNALGNEIRGSANAGDTLDGRAGDDKMHGLGGNDLYIVDSYGDQTIEEPNAGNDTVRTALANYTLQANVENLEFTGAGPLVTVGNELDNIISGNIGDDVIAGAGGNDTLRGNNGNDTLSGDAGNDLLFGGAGVDLLDGGEGNDQVSGGDGNDQVSGGDGDDTVDGGSGDDQVFGGSGVDTVTGGAGNDNLSGEAGNDFLFGGTGDDLVDGGEGNDQVSGGDGNDQVSGGDGDDTVDGGSGDDSVFGGSGVDTVTAGAGNDNLSGEAGNDFLFGGTGDDLLDGGEGNDQVSGGDGNDQVSGGGGDDTADGGTGDDQVFGGSGVDTLTGGAGNDNLSGEAGGDNVNGGDGNDIISGGTEDDSLTGGSGDDTISGGDGNDYIVEAAGADNIDGGAGIDTVDYSNSTVGISFNASQVGISGDALGDKLQNIEVLIGTAYADVLYGDAGDNTIQGGAGNDSLYGLAGQDHLEGGLGADAMAGGLGDDVYLVDDVGDVVTEGAGEGTDRVDTTLASYTLTSNVENLTFVGTGNFTGVGNALANVITGGTGDDTLSGRGGADTLIGGAGSDTADYSSSSAAVNVNLLTGVATGGDAAGDTFNSIENLTGSSFIDVLTGNDGDNIIHGGIGDDTLNGGGGNDTLWGGPGRDVLAGGTGNDIYIVDDAGSKTSWDKYIELANEGNDTVRSGTQTLDLTTARVANIENAELTGSGAFDLIGTGVDNILSGNNGANKITGGAGFDTLFGGGGNDIFHYNNISDALPSATSSELIQDFQVGIDKIDLSNIDANTTKGGNNAFSFIGGAAFTGAGQLRVFDNGTDTIVQANVNADLVADFEIHLTGVVPLTAIDFIL